MKKIFVLLFGLAAASQAFATAFAICNNPTTSGAGNTVLAATPAAFVVKDFQPRCSAHVFASSDENAVAFVVGSASSKGKNKFIGSTGGGGITGSSCSSVTCVDTDATSGLTAALNAAT